MMVACCIYLSLECINETGVQEMSRYHLANIERSHYLNGLQVSAHSGKSSSDEVL